MWGAGLSGVELGRHRPSPRKVLMGKLSERERGRNKRVNGVQTGVAKREGFLAFTRGDELNIV